MEQLALLIGFYNQLPRQGPGSTEDTLRALSFTGLAEVKNLQIADIGCGTGAQTIALAGQLSGRITAIDLFPELLNTLNDRVRTMNLSSTIETKVQSMDDLSFEHESLDLIWSEGAIYNIGFEKGIAYWKQFLKPGGFMGLSEITWLSEDRPEKIDEFWKSEYPDIDTAENKKRVLKDQGFEVVGYFELPPASWIDEYYEHHELAITQLLSNVEQKEAAMEFVQSLRYEMKLFTKFKEFYSYGFYVARKSP